MNSEEILKKLREPLPTEGDKEPALNAYLDRLDDLFGDEWKQEVEATAKGVRCEITIDTSSVYMTRSAIASDSVDAIKLCCYLLGMARNQVSYE